MNSGVQLDSIIEKQKKRYLLLRRIYELTDGVETRMIQLEPPEGIDQAELLSILDYLSEEGLVRQLAGNGAIIQISHRGVVEIEESVVNPSKSTEHFLPQVIQHIHGNVGSIQTGNQNTANVSQKVNDAGVLDLISDLRSHLVDESSDAGREGNELLDGLEAEINAPSPSQSRIKLYLKGLGTFVKDTGKDLLVEIGSRLITGQIGLS